MTITKQVPAGLLQALGLHKGDFMTVRDESSESFTIEITTAVPPTTAKAPLSRRQAALAKFAVGAAVEHASAPGDESRGVRAANSQQPIHPVARKTAT